jgi:hypothetical protein
MGKVTYVNIVAFAKISGVPAPTLRLMCRQGRIPGAIMPGNEWLIDPTRGLKTKFNKRGRPKNDK